MGHFLLLTSSHAFKKKKGMAKYKATLGLAHQMPDKLLLLKRFIILSYLIVHVNGLMQFFP
jgi:hypothetical protein